MKYKTLVNVIVAVLLLIGLYEIYSLFQDNTTKYQKYEHTIDSLNHEVVKLDSVHVKQDSIIVVYKDSVVYMDNIIEKEKIKYVEIKSKYNEIRNHVANYTHTELDSFFSKRYGY
jgi:hypothetical protein